MDDARLRRLNYVLLGFIIIINLYSITLPFLPGWAYWWRALTSSKPETVAAYITNNRSTASGSVQSTTSNRLIIPRMQLDTVILEGPESDSYNLLKAGAWRLPFSTQPAQGGNMVIAAHRFSYTGPRGLFYHLDKLQVGDEIGIEWDGSIYRYQVVSSRTVAPTEVSVQSPTEDARLTLYTCTPLLNPVNRLVVVALPVTEGSTP